MRMCTGGLLTHRGGPPQMPTGLRIFLHFYTFLHFLLACVPWGAVNRRGEPWTAAQHGFTLSPSLSFTFIGFTVFSFALSLLGPPVLLGPSTHLHCLLFLHFRLVSAWTPGASGPLGHLFRTLRVSCFYNPPNPYYSIRHSPLLAGRRRTSCASRGDVGSGAVLGGCSWGRAARAAPAQDVCSSHRPAAV